MSEIENVLFITADQWRADCLSAVGHPCVKTPNLDRLAEEGVLFRRHFAGAAPCSPGRASLYTGLYLQNHRVVGNGAPLDARHSNVALEARKAGYQPVLFGYTDIAADPRHHAPGDPALRTYEGLLPGMVPLVWLRDDQRAWLAHLRARGYVIPPGHYEVFRPKGQAPGTAGAGPTNAPTIFAREDSNTAFLTDEAIKYMAVHGDAPWFVHLSVLSPHPPFVVPEPYNSLYDPAAVPLPQRAASLEAEAAQHPWLAAYLERQGGTEASVGLDPARAIDFTERELRQVRATYYGMISEVDANVGRLIEFLRSSGQLNRTLIVFTTDHGEQLGDHWMFGKRGWFDQAFHIPLIVRDPRPATDRGRGRQINAFTEAVDVMPTILEWLGLEVPPACDGESLLPFLAGAVPEQWRAEAHWEFDFRDMTGQRLQRDLGLAADQCALNVIRGPRYKYVHFAALPPLFYDLQEDPHETRNLADEPACRELVLEHAQKLLSWRMTHDERTLTGWELTAEGAVQRKGPRYGAPVGGGPLGGSRVRAVTS